MTRRGRGRRPARWSGGRCAPQAESHAPSAESGSRREVSPAVTDNK